MRLIETVLENDDVRLEPLADRHRAELRQATDADRDIWTALFPISMAGEHFDPFWTDIMEKRRIGYALPFAVVRDGACVGFTSYLRINPDWRSLDIGGTYYRPEWRSTRLNPAAKLLLLDHAFACGARRVQFRVDALNARSRAAMVKLGAVEEGVIRQEKPIWTGRIQDTAVFSILNSEWPQVKAGLLRRLQAGPVASPALRLVAPGEAAQAEALLYEAFIPFSRKLGREPSRDWYRRLPQSIADGCVYGVVSGDGAGGLIGVAVVERDGPRWTISKVGVAPSLQRAGIGSLLLRHVEAKARAGGASSLHLETAAVMTDLLRLYDRHGFREVRRGPPEHGRDRHIRVFMEKRL